MKRSKIVMQLHGYRVYVYGDEKNFSVCLPGDLTNITDKLSLDERMKVIKKLRSVFAKSVINSAEGY